MMKETTADKTDANTKPEWQDVFKKSQYPPENICGMMPHSFHKRHAGLKEGAKIKRGGGKQTSAMPETFCQGQM
jgi:hypothetical protein